ncbi:hypothetical protein [Acinetobacter lactucae]|uniref:hypothetical protein n=1 Tax=Acinetobacter calcoaceticus/baumannii complex TaxID=909768 RepID=UPI0039F6D357
MYLEIIILIFGSIENDHYINVEVKGNRQYDDPILLGKGKAEKEYSSHSQIEYKMIRVTDADVHIYQYLLG